MSDIDIKAIAADIAGELREHPEQWTQNDYAKGALGIGTDACGPQACTWCLLGHLHRRTGGRWSDSLFSQRLGPYVAYLEISTWNDWPQRTVADVIALCERVAKGGRS
jgi:hypothetical protein